MAKTFIKITNQDIYKIIVDNNVKLEDRLTCMEKKNDEAHKRLEAHAIETNGKVKLNKWMVTTAITLVLVTLGFLFNHIAR